MGGKEVGIVVQAIERDITKYGALGTRAQVGEEEGAVCLGQGKKSWLKAKEGSPELFCYSGGTVRNGGLVVGDVERMLG